MKNIKQIRLINVLFGFIAVVFVLGFLSYTANAEYPDKPIKIVIPNSPGGSTDLTGRIFSQALNEILPVKTFPVNMAGGGSSIGSRYVAEQKPDGYTVLMVHQAMLAASAMGITGFDPTKTFEIIAQTGRDKGIFVIHPDSPYKNLSKLYEAARTKPNSIKTGVQIGALNHLYVLVAAQAGGVEFRPVQVGGGAKVMEATLGKHIDFGYVTLSDALSFHKAGEVVIMTIFDKKREKVVPEVPTAKEQGYDVELPIDYIWWFPKGTPKDRVNYFAEALKKAMETGTIKNSFKKSITEAKYIPNGTELDQFVASEYAKIKTVVEKAGLAKKK